MKIHVKFKEEPDYIYIQFTGQYNIVDYLALITTLFDEVVKRGYQRAICDISQVSGRIPNMDRFKLGEQFASVFSNQVRVAFIDRPEEIDNFFENVAVNRMAEVSVYSNKEAALKWLMEKR